MADPPVSPVAGQSGAHESGADESGAHESGAHESGADESGADESGAVAALLVTVEATLASDPPVARSSLQRLERLTRGERGSRRAWICAQMASFWRRDRRIAEALRLATEAAQLRPENWAVVNLVGLCLLDDGDPWRAAEVLTRATRAVDAPSGLWVNLGNAWRRVGDKCAAHDAYLSALERDAYSVAALYNLHAVLFCDGDSLPAERALERALAARPDHEQARFYLKAIRALCPSIRGVGGLDFGSSDDAEFLRTSCAFARERLTSRTRLFSDTFDTLAFALGHAGGGLVLELGVRRGTTLRWLAQRCQRPVFGFDAFEGLPEAWQGQPLGLYSTRGAHPRALPENARIRPGWFRDTLPAFLEEQRGDIALLNVDCDLYGSTRDALQILAPRIRPGAVLVFDEYLCNPGWEGEEHRALCEVAAQHGWRLVYLAFSLFTKQVVVQIA